MVLASQRKDIEWKENSISGDMNPNYGGGKYIDDKGYIRILDQNHPFNIKGYVYEHRAVMESYFSLCPSCCLFISNEIIIGL